MYNNNILLSKLQFFEHFPQKSLKFNMRVVILLSCTVLKIINVMLNVFILNNLD